MTFKWIKAHVEFVVTNWQTGQQQQQHGVMNWQSLLTIPVSPVIQESTDETTHKWENKQKETTNGTHGALTKMFFPNVKDRL